MEGNSWPCNSFNEFECQFPFKHGNKMFHGCVVSESRGSFKWCATSIDFTKMDGPSNVLNKDMCSLDCPGSEYQNEYF